MISAIVLAAGESRRFGSPKPLALIQGRPALTFLVEKLLLSKIDEVIVVLGAHAGQIQPLVPHNERIRCVVNERYASGQTSSFKKGLSLVNEKSRGALLFAADTPFVLPETIHLIVQTFLENSRSVVIPVYKDRAGHPPVFAKTLFPEFAGLADDEPLFTIQRRHEADTLKLPVSDEGIVLSFNTPQELDEIRKKQSVIGGRKPKIFNR